jgi:hypothetical protein
VGLRYKSPLRHDLTSTKVLVSAVLDLWTRADLCRLSAVCQRKSDRSPLNRQWALTLAPGSDPPAPTGTAVGDAVEAVGLATRADDPSLRAGPGVVAGGPVDRRRVVGQHELPLVDAALSGQRHGFDPLKPWRL